MRRELVLVADDDPACRAVIAGTLTDAGYRCLQAEGGRSALALMAERPDVLLTDMLMPDVDGVEVIMTVRRRWPQVRIVALSGGFGAMDAPKLLHMAKMLGADAAVSKPFTGSQLLASVAQALSYRRD